MDTAAAQRVLDGVFPQFSIVTAVLMSVVVPGLMYMLGFRFQWRRDKREEGESVAGLMARLSQMQGAELARLSAEAEGLHRQIELLSAGRYRLQGMFDTLRDQIIAARVMIHEYERRLGLPETTFPPLPLPIFTEPSKPA